MVKGACSETMPKNLGIWGPSIVAPKTQSIICADHKKGVKEEGIELPSVAFVCFWDRLVTTTTPLELEAEPRKTLFFLSLSATNEGRKKTYVNEDKSFHFVFDPFGRGGWGNPA